MSPSRKNEETWDPPNGESAENHLQKCLVGMGNILVRWRVAKMLPTYYGKNQLNVGKNISPMYPMGILGGFEKPFGCMAPPGAASRAWPWSGRPLRCGDFWGDGMMKAMERSRPQQIGENQAEGSKLFWVSWGRVFVWCSRAKYCSTEWFETRTCLGRKFCFVGG